MNFADPPESVQENARQLELIKQQRRRGNAATARKNDTERYLVIVFPDRKAKGRALEKLGLPADERYLASSSVELRLREGEPILTGPKAADPAHSGACG